MLENEYGSHFLAVQKTMAEIWYKLQRMKETPSKQMTLLPEITLLFIRDLYLFECYNLKLDEVSTLLEKQDMQEAERIVLEEIKNILTGALTRKDFNIQLTLEMQTTLSLNSSTTIDGFIAVYFELFYSFDSWKNRLGKKGMMFPSMLVEIYTALKNTTSSISFQDFIWSCRNCLLQIKPKILPCIGFKKWNLNFCLVSYENDTPKSITETQLWRFLTPNNRERKFNLNLLPKSLNIFEELCEKFPVIPRTIFDTFNPVVNDDDAEAFIKCFLLRYRMFSAKGHYQNVVTEYNTEAIESWSTKPVLALVLYMATKLHLIDVIEIFKDNRNRKNLSHTKVSFI